MDTNFVFNFRGAKFVHSFFALKQVIKVNKEIDDRGLDQQMNIWLIPGNI